jgi:Fe2+ or Zn2+ uptake regulation protein
MGKKKKKKKVQKVDYGSAEFYCRHCDYTFEIDWETIWDIQECTHGYVGYHLNDTFISCPKCDEICGDEEIPAEKRQVTDILDDDLPF